MEKKERKSPVKFQFQFHVIEGGGRRALDFFWGRKKGRRAFPHFPFPLLFSLPSAAGFILKKWENLKKTPSHFIF
jgi:hypothetical protein